MQTLLSKGYSLLPKKCSLDSKVEGDLDHLTNQLYNTDAFKPP